MKSKTRKSARPGKAGRKWSQKKHATYSTNQHRDNTLTNQMKGRTKHIYHQYHVLFKKFQYLWGQFSL
jgi:hypothetical protein